MTLINPSTNRPRSRSGTTTAASSGLATRAVRAVLISLWLVGVPVLAAVWANQRFGTAWGSVPAFWLDGDQDGPPIAGLLAALVVFAVAVELHRRRVIFLLGVLPAVGARIAYLVDESVWVGALAGLVIGGLLYFFRRPGR